MGTINIKLEYVDCPVCNQHNSHVAASGKDIEYKVSDQTFNFVKCLACGIWYLNPRPVPEEADRIYPKEYHSTNLNSPLHSDHKVDRIREVLDRNRCKDILSLLKSGDTVLDIGCGDGRMLRIFKKFGPKGINLIGIDINVSKEFITTMKGDGVDIIQSSFEDFDMSKLQNLKIAIMNELVEHLWNPSLCLKKISTHMKKGGYLSIETPDIDCISRKMFPKTYWGGYHFPRHLQLFSKKSMRLYLEENNFEIIKQSSILAPSFWIITLRNILGLNSYEVSGSIVEFLNFKNKFSLGVFSFVDLALMCMGFPTACQHIVAKRV